MSFTEFDPSEDLETEQDILDYLSMAAADRDPRVFQAALGDAAKAQGMTRISQQTGLSRQSLYKALSTDGNPSYATVSKVLAAFGGRLSVQPAEAPAA